MLYRKVFAGSIPRKTLFCQSCKQAYYKISKTAVASHTVLKCHFVPI